MAKRKSGKKKSKSARRSAAGKKAARTRARNARIRSENARKAARKSARKRKLCKPKRKSGKHKSKGKSKGKSRSRSAAAKKAAATRKRNKDKRRNAARKAARSRARHPYGTTYSEGDYAMERKKRRGGKRRKGKRKHHAKRKHHRKARRRNPVSGWKEIFASILGVGLSGILVVGADRFVAGHSVASGTDQPAAGGIYNLNAASAPLWSNFKQSGWKRIGLAVLQIGVPLTAAHFVKKHDAVKTFFQLYGFTAIGLTTAKVSTDVGAKLLGKKNVAMRLYPAEVSAQNALAASANLGAVAPPAQGIGTSSSGTGLLAYVAPPLGLGKPAGCPHVGAGQSCCSSCGCQDHKGVPRAVCGCKGGTPGTNQGPGSLPGSNPSGGTPFQGTVPPYTPPPGGITGNPAQAGPSPFSGSTGVQGAPKSSVTPIASRFAKSRFDRSKFGT